MDFPACDSTYDISFVIITFSINDISSTPKNPAPFIIEHPLRFSIGRFVG